MILEIQQCELGEKVGFTVVVDTEAKFKKGDILCGYVKEYPNFQDKDAPPRIPAYWFLSEAKSDNAAKLFNLVDKHYKVIEIKQNYVV